MITESIKNSVPNGRKSLYHQGFSQRNPYVIYNKETAFEVICV